jgi:hypothetical protein
MQRRVRFSWLAAGLLLAASGSAGAQSPKEDDQAFSVFLDAAPHVLIQSAKGNADSNFGIASKARNTLTNMTFRLGGGAVGPILADVWGKPRPVAWAAALVPLNESSVIGTEFIETASGGAERLEFSKFAIEYQTSAVAGVGLELVTPVFGFDLRVRPGLEWLHLVARYTGIATLETQSGLNNNSASVAGKKKFEQNFLGPALHVSTPTVKINRFQVDFFLHTSVQFDVSGGRRTLGASDGVTEKSARFSFETGSTAIQLTSGLKIRWP